MTDRIIEVTHLAKHFGKFKAIEDISFEVFKGDVFGFLGPNGAGKSTTIRCLLTLIKPTAGEIHLFGKNLLHHRNDILGKIGSIVEKPDFYKYLSAEKNLQIFGRMSGAYISRSKIYEMIEFVGLKGRERDNLSGYSHGMKQRLGIAQALLHDPELIILDEPTTGLDPQGIIDIRNLILQLKNEQNKTVVISSHILSEIELIANRMVIINNGKSVVEGSVTDLLNAEEMIVSFEVDDAPKAKQIMDSTFTGKIICAVKNNNLLIHVAREKIPMINKALSDQGICIFSIESKRKLEDYFLKLIHH
jgi:ABC-type multidrug transport system ATPase subunit